MSEAPQFVVFRDANGCFEWALVVGNRTLAVSRQTFETHDECLASIGLLIDVTPRTGVNDRVDGRWQVLRNQAGSQRAVLLEPGRGG